MNEPTTPRRVLVEHADGAMTWAAERILRRAGFEVSTCNGPEHLPGHRCPLVAEGRCDLVDTSDVVVFGLGTEHVGILRAERTTAPSTPVVIEGLASDIDEFGWDATGCEVVSPAGTGVALVAAVERALARTPV